MEKAKVKIGIIGCGWFGNFHLDNLLKMEGISLTCLSGRNVESLEKTGKKVPSARLYQDYRAMLKKEKLDGVIVCVTPDAHGEIEELCCKRKINMYIEKPIELSLDNASKIADDIRFSNIITSVGYQERYSTGLGIVKDILSRENVGLINAYWFGDIPGAKWWHKKEQSGGQVVEQSTHLVDLMRYLLGEVDEVYATGVRDQRFEGDHNVEDYSSAILSFKNNVKVSLSSGCYGKAASKIGFQLFAPNFIIDYTWAKSVKVISGDKCEEIKIPATNHFTSLKTFIDAIKSGDRYQILSPYEDALESLKVTLAINKSIEEGKPIKI